jgi:hypothetical protein
MSQLKAQNEFFTSSAGVEFLRELEGKVRVDLSNLLETKEPSQELVGLIQGIKANLWLLKRAKGIKREEDALLDLSTDVDL